MNRIAHTFARDAAQAQSATLAQRILAGILDNLPEHYSNREWTEAAQACRDCEDEAPLLHMVEVGRLHDAHLEWQRAPRSEREADRRQFVDIEQGPLAHEYLKLADAGYRRVWPQAPSGFETEGRV